MLTDNFISRWNSGLNNVLFSLPSTEAESVCYCPVHGDLNAGIECDKIRTQIFGVSLHKKN
jgi:hypothetical protein